MVRRLAVVTLLAALSVPLVRARTSTSEPVDLVMVTRIREEGLKRSQVMETVQELTDVIGPRLTGSPQMRRANEWTRARLAGWGLANAHVEAWGPFGRGWSYERSSVTMVAPHTVPLIALPKAWTPGTAGPVRGKVKRVRVSTKSDFDRHKGKLAGLILFLSPPRTLRAPERPLFARYTDGELESLSHFDVSGAASEDGDGPRRTRRRFQRDLAEFLAAEKALATVEVSERDGAVVRVMGAGSREKDENPGVPALVMAAEHYNRVLRLVDKKQEVELELDVKAAFHDEDAMAANTFAEIPGTTDEVVMAGAHLDSWHAGTGATDNAAGSAVVMEAVRILKALDVKPRRTIRVALWSGEEQGLLGSRAYVERHFAERSDAEEARRSRERRRPRGALTLKPPHAKLSAYFNVDNGTGKIRGIYTQQNAAAAPLFEAWLEPLRDLGSTTVTNRNTGGTDHLSFDEVGLPGFQFIQDQADYATRTHHTNLDVYDRLQREDLIQASVVLASFLYNAAHREERFPRKPLSASQLGPQPTPTPEPTPDPDASPEPEQEGEPSPSPSPVATPTAQPRGAVR
jgi:carboxypeptidase Q